MKEIFERRSIRKFKDRPIEKEKIEQILRAAMQAPSAANQQPWEFIIVEDKEMLSKLSETSLYAKPAQSSAMTIVLVANEDNLPAPDFWHQDLSAAAQNILLEAAYLGLGTVWMGVAPRVGRMNYIRELFDLPGSIIPFALIAVGYRDGNEPKFTDRYKPDKVHYEKW